MCMCMLQIDLPLVCHIKLALMLTSILSTSSAVYHSAVAGRSENLIRVLAEKVNHYNS